MWPSTPDCREIVDTRGSLLGERTAALLRGELEGLGPPDLCCIYKVPLDRKLPRLFVGADDPEDGTEVSFCHFVVGVDVSQPAPIAAYLCQFLRAQEQPAGWFRRGWRVVRCVYCTYNALHQQDLRVELSCQGTAPRTVQVRLLEASGREKEGPDIPPSSWGGVALCALMRSEVPPGVPGLRVMRGPLAVPWAGGSCEGSRAFLELFEKHAAEGDLLGLLPSTGRGTNALCEILAGHLLQSAALLPCVETLASLQGGSPLMALHISRAYARRGQLEAALSALLRCLHAYPEEACLLRQLAELLLRGGLHELAARAASYAVELCPTVPRYWLTLARAEIACGCWGNALLALNAAPDVSVSFPFYPHGLPSDLDTYPVTQPRQQGMGYYSALWLAPVKPELLPFRHRGSTHSGGEIFSGATAAPTAGALLRTPKGLLDSGRKSSTSQGTEHFTSSLTSSYRSHPSGTPRDLEAAGGSPSPTRLEASGSAPAVTAASFVPPQRRSEGGPFYHRGFGASFGLAKGLDEETVIRAHAEMVQKERKPQGRASHTDLEALWRRCSSGSTAEHLRVMIGSRAQALDLSERRRYSVLASLHKRIGLRGLNALRGALFLPSADNATGIAPNTLMEGSSGSGWLAASGAEGPTTAAISSLPVTQEGGGLGASSPDCCSFEAGMETVIGEAAETEMYDAEALNCMHADSLASPASSCRDPPSPTRLSLPAESVCDEASGEAVPEAVRSPVASVLRDETKDLRDSVTGNDFKASSVVGGPLQAAQGGINNDATGKLGEVPATVDARDGPTRRDSEGCHIGQQKQHPVVEATLRTLAGDEDSIHDVLLRPSLAASLSLETPVASVGGVRAAVRQLSPSLAGLLAVQYKQHSCSISRIRVVPPGRSLDVAVLTSYVAPGPPDDSREAEDAETPPALGAYWLYRGAVCERLQEWVEMEAAYRIAITQGVSPLALRGLLRLYVRMGLPFEALRIACVAAQQLSALCGILELPFLPAWLTTQLMRLVQSEGIEAMLEAAESVPHNEKHPVVQQLIETQRSQLQAEG